MINELIESANRLCQNLDLIHQREKELNKSLYIHIERYKIDVYNMMNDIQELRTFSEEKYRNDVL